MAALGLDHYNIRAPSPLLEELRDFYVATVGLRVGPRPLFRSFGYWLYAGDKDVLHLSRTRAGETREVGAVPTFDHVAFACENFEAMRAALIAAGIAYTIDDVPLTGRRQVFFRDPAGNGVELNFGMESA
jgi:catechol 2,3-dioxygenase-like lactoylglutathione lyase family enzyme